MSADAPTTRGDGFPDRLFDRLRESLADRPDSRVSIETSVEGRRADLFLERGRAGNLVVEVTRETTDPRGRGTIARTRDRARDLDADAVAACNSNHLFLFDDRGEDPSEAAYYYLDLGARPLADGVASVLAAVDRLHRDGQFPEQSRRDRLAGTLRSFHGSIWPALRAAASDAYGSDGEFTDTFEEWVAENGHGDRDRSGQFEMAAKRYAYLLMNRVLCSAIARQRAGPSANGGRPLAHTADGDPPDGRLPSAAADRRFATGSGLFESFPHNAETRRGILDLARTVESEPVARGDEALLDGIYEDLIPDDEREALGQFYTPPAIAETLVRWTLGTGDGDPGTPADGMPRVLDPASGSGAFVAEAYTRLAERFPDASHRELLDHVLAVDVERFPLRIAATRLASRRADDAPVNAYHASFFDLDPTTDPVADGRIDALGAAGGEIGPVDAVVGNPPYIEAGDLSPDRAHFRDHLRAFGPGNATPYLDGEGGIGANADAYVYFVTHATQFLRDGGRLGVVIPTKWMTSRYGEQFRGFLHDHYRIEAVVGFGARAFEDALVDTALLLLEKCSDGRERRENAVEFVQLRGAIDADDLLGTIGRDHDTPAGDGLTVTTAGTARTVRVRQSYLEDETEHGKIGHYLVAPEDLIALVDSPELVALGEMADIARGAMTGSTSFFFPDAEAVEAHGIEDRFLRPALKSMRGHDAVVCGGGDVDRRFVDTHGYVETIRDRQDPADGSLEEAVKNALEEDGYTGLRSWIRHAESEDEHRGATCQRRRVWFDFGDPPRPDILFQKLLRERLFSIYNRAGAVPSNAVDCIDVHDDVDSKVLFGVLNSSITRAIMEVWGRNEAGMLQLMTYETRSLPVPDVRSMSGADRSAIASVVDDILEQGDPELSEDRREQLDAAVLGTLDSIGTPVDRIREIQRFMLDRRVASGETAEVLLDGTGSGGGDSRSEPGGSSGH